MYKIIFSLVVVTFLACITPLQNLKRETLYRDPSPPKIQTDLVDPVILVNNPMLMGGGTGIVFEVQDKLCLLTASHVFQGVKNTLKPKEEFFFPVTAKITLSDSIVVEKLCLLKLVIDNPSIDYTILEFPEEDYQFNFFTVEFRDYNKLEPVLGEEVYAVGYPLGFGPVLTYGIVSKVEKKSFISSAPIFLGNSGGAVYRKSDGTLLGITTNLMGSNNRYAEHLSLTLRLDRIYEDLVDKGFLNYVPKKQNENN